uniref:Uncharacterized protein n=1 Tax=mine drainage metagenome TaxID=410659 RepID=E6PUG1_9ZZZZ
MTPLPPGCNNASANASPPRWCRLRANSAPTPRPCATRVHWPTTSPAAACRTRSATKLARAVIRRGHGGCERPQAAASQRPPPEGDEKTWGGPAFLMSPAPMRRGEVWTANLNPNKGARSARFGPCWCCKTRRRPRPVWRPSSSPL